MEQVRATAGTGAQHPSEFGEWNSESFKMQGGSPEGKASC